MRLKAQFKQQNLKISGCTLKIQIFINTSKLKQFQENILTQLTGDLFRQITNNQLKYRQGYQFLPLINYKKWTEEEDSEIEHVPGQILVIFFWDHQTIIDDIKLLVESLKKNKERWGKSVRMIVTSLSLSSYSESDMEGNEQYANFIDFYFPDFSLRIIAFEFMNLEQDRNRYFVVDTFGTIMAAEVYDIDYQLIENLLLEQNSQQILDEGDFTEEAAQDLINLTQQAEIKEKLLQIDKPSSLDFKINLETHKIEGQIKFKKPTLNLTYRDIQQQEVNWILENLFQFIPEAKWKINKTVQKTISVEYPGSVCAVCKKDILQQPQQYYCPFKKEHVCVECAEFDDQAKQGAEKFKYLNTLIFINGPLTDLSVQTNIDDQKIGNNYQKVKNQTKTMECLVMGVALHKAHDILQLMLKWESIIILLIIAKSASQFQRIRNQKKRKK